MFSSVRSLLLPIIAGLLTVLAVLPVLAAQPVSVKEEASSEVDGGSLLSPSAKTQGGTKILELTIPAPRGQIVDRVGRPLAQNRVAYFPALMFPHMENPSDDEIAAYGAAALEQLNHMAHKLGDKPPPLVCTCYT